jgi:NAD(P)-dependent dehydrogenase (short-subunit alcohol dehydrogenase family)
VSYPLKTLAGQIAVITGSSRGIGAALAIELGARGAQCVLIARTVGGLEATDNAIRRAGGPPATLVPLDLAQEQDRMDALGAELYQRFGRVDLLIGNAATLGGGLSPVGHIQPQQWQEVFALNLTANYRLLRSLDPLLRQSQKALAAFLNCDTGVAPFWSAYAASKQALQQLVACYAAEMQTTKVRACCLTPPPTATKLRATAFPGENPETLPSAAETARQLVAEIMKSF